MIISGCGCQTNCKIASIDKEIGLIAQTEERGVCNAEAMGSNPIESSAVKVKPSRFFDAPGDASHQGRAEGHT